MTNSISSFVPGTPKVIRHKFSKLELHTDSILEEIRLHSIARIREAAKHSAKVMKKNVSKKGVSVPEAFPGRRTGGLKRSIGYRIDVLDESAFVGSKSPLVHLLEFGHGDGKERNKRPFVFKSLKESEPEIISIMSREYF
jgi:hypothetical protein